MMDCYLLRLACWHCHCSIVLDPYIPCVSLKQLLTGPIEQASMASIIRESNSSIYAPAEHAQVSVLCSHLFLVFGRVQTGFQWDLACSAGHQLVPGLSR
jgi:hypothetical protein